VDSARVAAAQARALQRLRRQRAAFRPLGLVVIAVVAVGAINGHPAPAASGRGLGVVLALAAFAVTFAIATRDRFPAAAVGVQAAVLVGMGAGGVALAALQTRGPTGLAGSAAVWMAVARLPDVLAIALGGSITVGLTLATALVGSSAGTVTAVVLLCALFGLVAYFIREARASQDRTELLLAQLEDARETELEAAAVTERGRIAAELHDVLAHSLSGAAIQLQGARKLAERDDASAQVRGAIDRAGELVRDGLANARQAVGALRGELPNVAQLESLVDAFRKDANAEVSLAVEGDVRPLQPEASLALYRGAQEALTNVARYAPGAVTTVVLRYESGRATLTVEDRIAHADGAMLAGVGGGRGLAGLRERVERAGGSVQAGPTPAGWRVEVDVPG
jgi:signal transduction histidine kinase